MRFLHFGPPAKPLFGTLHGGRRLRQPASGVVLCNPFGEEAARAHRVYRVMATNLERQGFPTLRFDYHGTGDSAGDSDSAGVADWLDDVATAATELTESVKPRRLALLGLRLGGSIAALACAERRVRVDHLLLWDPVVRGDEYLRELAAAHRSYMRAELGEAWRDELKLTTEGYPDEALGTQLGPALRDAIAAIDLTQLEIPCDAVTVVSTTQGKETNSLRQHLERSLRHRVTWVDVSTSAPWNSDEALNSAIIPADVVAALVERVQAVAA